MKILGVDPGSKRAGYGVVLFEKNDPEFVCGDLVNVPSNDQHQRLVELYESFEIILDEQTPDVVGVEKLFFTKNIKTGIEVAQARGIFVLCAKRRNLPIYEFTPSEIKCSLTGDGRADKKAVEKMVRTILKIDDLKKPDDVYDALGVALVTGYKLNSPLSNL